MLQYHFEVSMEQQKSISIKQIAQLQIQNAPGST